MNEEYTPLPSCVWIKGQYACPHCRSRGLSYPHENRKWARDADGNRVQRIQCGSCQELFAYRPPEFAKSIPSVGAYQCPRCTSTGSHYKHGKVINEDGGEDSAYACFGCGELMRFATNAAFVTEAMVVTTPED